jgi:RHH-type rel operon transcriptional repressor/antitoxin RelB
MPPTTSLPWPALLRTVLPGDVHLDPSTEEQLNQLAMDTGRNKTFHLRELVEQGIDDLEDFASVARV